MPKVRGGVSDYWVMGLDGVKVHMPKGTRWAHGLDNRVVPLGAKDRWVQGLDGRVVPLKPGERYAVVGRSIRVTKG